MGAQLLSKGKVKLGKALFTVITSVVVTYDPASLTTATETSSADQTVTGAALGDHVLVAAPYDLQGLIVTAYVKSANTVVIRVRNGTAGTVDLASGSWRLTVIRCGG